MKRKPRALFKLFLFIFCTTVLFSSLYLSSNRIMEEYGAKNFTANISNASYYAIDEVLKMDYDYKSLVDVEKNNDGDIVMVYTQSYRLNEMAASAARTAYRYLEQEVEKGVEVPLGAFTGIRLISGFGYPVKMKLLSVGSVKCTVTSEFQEAGINQTRHLMYLNIFSEISIVTKISTKTVGDTITVLAYDNLIVGKVPSVLVNSSVVGRANA